MLHSGKLFRAEIYTDNKYPYTDVKQLYEANKGRYPDKRLFVMNGHWWDSKAQFVGNLKANGVVLSREWDSTLGYAWSGNEQPVFGWHTMTGKDNFLSTIPAIQNGIVLKEMMEFQSAGVKRSVPRTWWGFDKDGKCYFEVTTTYYTLLAIADRMKSLGIYNGLVLDGSGSSQYYDGETHIKGDGRIVLCFLLLWFDEAPLAEKCPYSEPWYIVGYGSRGNGAKWVQWYLNKHGANLVVDGVFGKLSRDALKAFQKAHGLAVDGLCGKATRRELKGGES